jgi:hypothetical protein
VNEAKICTEGYKEVLPLCCSTSDFKKQVNEAEGDSVCNDDLAATVIVDIAEDHHVEQHSFTQQGKYIDSVRSLIPMLIKSSNSRSNFKIIL